MAQLWFPAAAAGWCLLPLSGAAVRLATLPAELLSAPWGDSPAARACLFPLSSSSESRWALLAPPDSGVRVNGLPLATGFRLLLDRDQVRAGGAAFFFSTERLARVEPRPAAPEPVICPRCGREIGPGQPAVQCPQCAIWHHQDDESPCWTYAETCALCPQPTDLQAGFQWTPHALCHV